MDLLEQIKFNISDFTISNLSNNLEEGENGTRLGLNLGLNTFLAAVIKFVSSESSAENLLKILNDGGHTGNIFNNIETFSGSRDKAKLLETIGENIVNHFIKDNKTEIVASLSNISGIKNISALSLLDISAPIVLGFIGKKVREQGMNSKDLFQFLNYERNAVSSSLPQSIRNILNLNEEVKNTKSKVIRHSEAISELNKTSNSSLKYILPWLVLLLLSVFLYFFSRQNERKNQKADISVIEGITETGKILPRKSEIDSMIVAEMPKTDSTSLSNQNSENFKNTVKPEENKQEEKLKEKKLESSQTPKPVAPKANKSKSDASAQKTTPVYSTPKGYTEIGRSAFGKNSAEITDKTAILSLINLLKDPKKKIQLAPMKGSGRLGRDRVYAIRDQLLESGANLSQIEILPALEGNNYNGVAIKTN